MRVEDAIAAVARGEIVVVVDDVDRENEGDLVMGAQFANPDQMGFFVRHTSGLICAAVTAERADELELPLMVTCNTEAQRTAFTVTVDYRHGTTTGISAADRARSAKSLADPATEPGDLSRPGHLHVLRARHGGVLARPGHTEAAVDLARMAGLLPAGVLSEVVSEDGLGMASHDELVRFAERHGLVMTSVAELIRYRLRTERLAWRTAQARLPTEWGQFTCYSYRTEMGAETHLALVVGRPEEAEQVLVEVHRECLAGDVFSSSRCGCGTKLRAAMCCVAAAGVGVVVYLRGLDGRGGAHTVGAGGVVGFSAGDRDYAICAQILADLGVGTAQLVSGDSGLRSGLEGFGVEISGPNPGGFTPAGRSTSRSDRRADYQNSRRFSRKCS